MEKGVFTKGDLHKAYNALLFYSGIRRGESRRLKKEAFTIVGNNLVLDVGKRDQSKIETEPLRIPLSLPYVDTIVKAVEATEPGKDVFAFCDKTAYNIVSRVFHCPMLIRNSRIAIFYNDGASTDEIKGWMGLSAPALEVHEPVSHKKAFNDLLERKATRLN